MAWLENNRGRLLIGFPDIAASGAASISASTTIATIDALRRAP